MQLQQQEKQMTQVLEKLNNLTASLKNNNTDSGK
jgi:hypothetical protein